MKRTRNSFTPIRRFDRSRGSALSCRTFWCRRSEEHTSELQSLAYLVCRLLLEKKNNLVATDSRSTTARSNSVGTPGVHKEPARANTYDEASRMHLLHSVMTCSRILTTSPFLLI